MKLSKILAMTLLGAVAMTNSAMASGTTAGTKISNTPTLTYSMNGKSQELKAPASSYVVDKVINFTLKRDAATEQKIQVGMLAYVPYTLSNIGNSAENFVVKGNQSYVKDFAFSKTMVFVDKNGNGNLDANEKVATSIVNGLKADAKRRVWIAVETAKTTAVGKRNAYGIEVRATPKGEKEIYTVQTVKNTMGKMDIVFADGKYNASADKIRDNKMILWYGWNTINVDAKLTILHYNDFVTADPINGSCTTYADCTSARKYKSIPGATVIRIWNIQNNTGTTATNVRFSVKIDSKVEKAATTNKNVWWRTDKSKRIHILWSKAKGIFGSGIYNAKTNSVDFTVKEIKPKETIYAYPVMELK